MATKKNNYITEDLDWAESQLSTWRTYVNNNPIHKLTDRKDMGRVVETVGQQIKCLTELMEKYLKLLEVVNNLREKEEAKIETRGKAGISAMAEDWAKKNSK